MEEKITILDVARKAGVSKGTVDRVLHNRGEVSAKSAAKVRRAIEELDYEPNLYASLLASKNAHVIACLLPEFSEGAYWEKVNTGVIQAREQISSLNVRVQSFYFNQFDAESFRNACRELLATDPSGVVLPPLFMSDTQSMAAELHSRGIPYVYIDGKLEEDNYFAYFGMPMYKSGYLCAALLTERLQDVKEVAVIRINRDRQGQADPTVSRRAGFVDYMAEHFPDCSIHSVFLTPSNPEEANEELQSFFSSHPDLKYVAMFNSRIHLLDSFLATHKPEGGRVIGFDDLDRNLKMLREGRVDILVSQDTEAQSRLAVTALSDYILLRKRPARRDNYMHMNILTRYNID